VAIPCLRLFSSGSTTQHQLTPVVLLLFASVFDIVCCLSQVRDSFKPLLGEKLSSEVEEALFALQSAAGALYKSQWRDIIANLKDAKNDLKSARQTR